MIIRLLITLICYLAFFTTPAASLENEELSFRLRANHQPNYEWNDVDVKAEIVLGRKVASRILGQYPIYNNKKMQKYVSLLGQGISEILGRSELNYYFTILDSNHVNAYAAPGGYIFITKGLLKKCRNEAQLIGVLAHEISHVNRRYIVKKYNIRGNQSSLLSYTSILAGASTQTARLSLNILLDKITDSLLSEGLDKKEELKADQDAIKYMSSLNYDPSRYKQLIASLYSNDSEKSVSHTHPSKNERLEAINEAYKELSKKGDYTRKKRFKYYVK